MKDKIIALLKPQASPDVKLSVISLFLARCLEMYEARIVDLEARQLQKGDKGDSVTVEDVLPVIKSLHKDHLKSEMDDLKVIMEKTWDKW